MNMMADVFIFLSNLIHFFYAFSKYYKVLYFFQVLNALFALSNMRRDKEKGGIKF